MSEEIAQKLKSIFEQNQSYKDIIEKGEHWSDPDFPHDDSSLQGRIKSYPWKSAREIFGDKLQLYNSFSAEDIEQGALGNCYLLSALSALAEFPGRVQKLFVQKDPNSAGCYVVRLFLSGQFVDITVDDYFPVNKKGIPAFAGSKANELWVMLIEKAWAKVHKSYGAIASGDSRESYAAITGAPVKCYKHSLLAQDKLWDLIHKADKASFVMSTGTDTDEKGIRRDHTYTLINTYDVQYNNEQLRLVQLRNPWGKIEWTGDWNDKDPKWTPELNKAVGHVVRNDGIFFMSLMDFAKVFMRTFVAFSRDDYIHTILPVKGTEAMVAFKVDKHIKGHLSAYELTKRLGRLIDKSYDLSVLILEIYVYDDKEKKFIMITDSDSNIAGQSNAKIDLEPGIYIARAYFKTPTKIPYISFVGYTNSRLEFVELTPEPIANLNIDRISRTLRENKAVYKVEGGENKLAGAFHTCPSGHKLAHVTKPFDKTYKCDNCGSAGKASNGWWFCEQCNYTICVACRPRLYSLYYRDFAGDTEKLVCQKNHPMTFTPLSSPKEFYICSRCGAAYLGSVPRWKCFICKLNICRRCFPPPKTYTPQGEQLEITTCNEGHKLTYVVSEAESTIYTCIICKKMCECNDGRWTCPMCRINICNICKKYDIPENVILRSPSKVITCDEGDPLIFTCSPPEEGSEIICNRCERVIGDKYWRWNCQSCGYDLCTKCKPAPDGRKDLICPNMHELSYSTLPQNNETYGRCTNCHKAVNFVEGRYCCLPCRYICCKDCIKDISHPELK